MKELENTEIGIGTAVSVEPNTLYIHQDEECIVLDTDEAMGLYTILRKSLGFACLCLFLTSCAIERPKYTKGDFVKLRGTSFEITGIVPQTGRQVFYTAYRGDGAYYPRLAQVAVRRVER